MNDFIDLIKNLFLGIFYIFIAIGIIGFLFGYPLVAIALLLLYSVTKD